MAVFTVGGLMSRRKRRDIGPGDRFLLKVVDYFAARTDAVASVAFHEVSGPGNACRLLARRETLEERLHSGTHRIMPAPPAFKAQGSLIRGSKSFPVGFRSRPGSCAVAGAMRS